jgi:GNAT superfamily N-acetyltransferase
MPAQQPVGTGARLRAGRRHDVPGLVDLRVRYLAETARADPRFGLMPDVRERTSHAIPVWLGQEDRILLVAEEGGTEDGGGTLVGYATGVLTVWPPVLRNQRVGEVQEVFILPDRRGRGSGLALMARLVDLLRGRGAQVLRAPVPLKNESLRRRFETLGFRALQVVMERNLSEV